MDKRKLESLIGDIINILGLKQTDELYRDVLFLTRHSIGNHNVIYMEDLTCQFDEENEVYGIVVDQEYYIMFHKNVNKDKLQSYLKSLNRFKVAYLISIINSFPGYNIKEMILKFITY